MDLTVKKVKQYSLGELITLINNGDQISLPDFQREFVWGPKQMAKLIESIILHYPIGTLMFLNAKNNLDFGKRSFRGTTSFNPKNYVIDGQQRIYTIYKLFNHQNGFKLSEPLEINGKKYKFFIDMLKKPNADDFDIKTTTFIYFDSVDDNDSETIVEFVKDKLFPLEFILENRLIKYYLKGTSKNGKVLKQFWKNKRKQIKDIQSKILKYKVPVEFIQNKLQPQDHYNIFQLLNEGGTDLTLFDLFVAKLNPLGINLRRLWKETQNMYPEIKKDQFDIDPSYILKVMVLLKAIDLEGQVDCSNKGIRNLAKLYDKGREFERDWNRASKHISEAIKYMEKRYGVPNKKLVPYYPMIVVLAGIKGYIVKEKFSQIYLEKINKKIDKWYWGSILRSEFDSSTDSKISKHFKALAIWINPRACKIPTEINFKFYKNDIKKIINEIKSSGDARYKAILCIPLANSAKDFYSGEELRGVGNLQDHHIYPKEHLKEQDISENEKINNIANRMLVTQRTNGTIWKKSPYEYLKRRNPKLLEQHFLSSKIVNEKMDYFDFLEMRRRKMVNFIYENLIW